MEYEFRNAEHYASAIRDIILTAEPDKGEEDLPETLVKYWAKNMYDACYDAYNNYIMGKRDDYRLTDEEANEEFNKAGLEFTQELLNGMVDKDLLEVSISPEGDLMYNATKKAQKAIKRHGRPRKK